MESNLVRFMIEKAVDRALSEIRNKSKRELRNLVELGMYHATGRFQSEFFGLAQQMLADQDCPYYDAVFRLANTVDDAVLKTFGINVGYNAWTAGAQRIREYEAVHGHNVPWTIVFDLSAASLPPENIDDTIRQGRSIGICCYFFRLESCADFPEWLPRILNAYGDCGFVLFLRPEQVTRAAAQGCRRAGNAMCVLSYTQERERLYQSAADILIKARSLLAASIAYGERRSLAWIKSYRQLPKEYLPALTFLVEEPGCEPETAQSVRSMMEEAAIHPTLPTLFVDLYRDIERVDRIISSDACYMEIGGSGGVKANRLAPALYNICEDTLAALLKKLFPKAAHA
ncbi:MAG TPA: hypothetical protein VN366_04040 [Feifaniaceae bacterium]|nr:hypothetical protein [Feifaniaceae bacterium]